MLLAETQSAMRAALLVDAIAPDAAPANRIAIHRRHYHASLMTALATKFPATLWLLGSPRFNELATAYLAAFPPVSPCIAEYGENFPEFVALRPIGAERPYIAAVASADWHLGQVSIAISRAPLAAAALSSVDPMRLPDIRLSLQPGLRFLESDWPIDALIALHLGGDAPAQFTLERERVWLQFSGARGTFGIDRLDPPTFAFRRAIREGATVGMAAEMALAAHAGFDPGVALATLFAAGLVVDFALPTEGAPS